MLIAVFLAGLRHGFDLDHIAAISDITSSQMDRRRAYVLGTLYAVGHAVVLFILGTLAIVVGGQIPDDLDSAMGRVIGASLVLLGVYVLYALIRFGRDARLRSRWMLVLAGLKRTLTLRRRPGHTHVVRATDDPFTDYGIATSLGIGMIHGVGAETPSQIVLLTAAAGVAGTTGGVLVLCAFVAGLLVGNTILVASTAAAFARGRRLPVVYAVLAAVTGAVSIIVGSLYVAGRADLLPRLLTP